MNRYGWGVGAGSIFLGLGLGGFFDGIVLHQILQWHHMLSAIEPVDTVRGLEINTLGDGLFHLGTYIFTVVGLALLWRRMHQQHRQVGTTSLIGGLLLGWGLFNLVEGLVDHHILQVHHVRPGPNQLLWDIGFLLWGAVMAVAGAILMWRCAKTSVEKA
jgi:uncharacterized membrane protein